MSSAVQTTITQSPAAGVPGELYDTGATKDVISKVALVDIPFGAFVKITDAGVTLPAASGDVTGVGRGVALLAPEKASGVGYKAGDIVNVLQSGRVWVQTETAVTAYVSPFVRFTANGGNNPGGYRNDADTARAVQPPGCRMFNTIAVAGMAVLELLADPT